MNLAQKSPRFGSYHFGVEIEVIAEPRVPALPKRCYIEECNVQYEKLADEMQLLRLDAKAEKRWERYKSQQDFKRWTIMKDTSLENPAPEPAIALEAVSPILATRRRWATDIDRFWEAHRVVFKTPWRSRLAGFHVHVSPATDHGFAMCECRAIAYGSVYFDAYIHELLPDSRRESGYCRANTLHSSELKGGPLGLIDYLIRATKTKQDLINVMQGEDRKHRRYMLWNFENLVPKLGRRDGSQSGTIEFRGGSGVRGPVATKRWIAFIIAFIDLCLAKFDTLPCTQSSELKDLAGCIQGEPLPRPSRAHGEPLESFYRLIRLHAAKFQMETHLPMRWQGMNESHVCSRPPIARLYDSNGIETSEKSLTPLPDISVLGLQDNERPSLNNLNVSSAQSPEESLTQAGSQRYYDSHGIEVSEPSLTPPSSPRLSFLTPRPDVSIFGLYDNAKEWTPLFNNERKMVSVSLAQSPDSSSDHLDEDGSEGDCYDYQRWGLPIDGH